MTNGPTLCGWPTTGVQTRPLEGRESNILVLRDPVLTGVKDPATDAGESAWEGMSGAAVFHGDALIGVVIEHHPAQNGTALTVRPVAALLDPSQDQATGEMCNRLRLLGGALAVVNRAGLTVLREMLDGLRWRTEELPYGIVERGAPPLSAIYVEQQQEARADALATSSASPGSSAVSHSAPVLQTTDEALDAHRHVLVEGDPGSGKSTLGNHLVSSSTQAWLDGGRLDYVAVSITARALAESQADLAATLAHYVQTQLGPRLSQPLTREVVREPAGPQRAMARRRGRRR